MSVCISSTAHRLVLSCFLHDLAVLESFALTRHSLPVLLPRCPLPLPPPSLEPARPSYEKFSGLPAPFGFSHAAIAYVDLAVHMLNTQGMQVAASASGTAHAGA